MKVIWLVVVLIFALQGASTIEIDGVRTSAGCEKIESQKSFGYYSWAEVCPAYSFRSDCCYSFSQKVPSGVSIMVTP